jgi:hypothetical protein
LHCRRHVEAKRLSRLQIDVKLDFGGLLDRQVGGFFALENPAGIIARQAVCLPKIRSAIFRPISASVADLRQEQIYAGLKHIGVELSCYGCSAVASTSMLASKSYLGPVGAAVDRRSRLYRSVSPLGILNVMREVGIVRERDLND